MRTNKFANSADKNNAFGGNKAALIKLLIVAVCFVTVFAITLSFGAPISIGDNVAEATGNNEPTQKNGEQTEGNATPFYGDGGDILPSKIDFPGRGNATTWTFTETFDTIAPTSDNQSIYKETGNTRIFWYTNEGTGGNDYNQWLFGVKNGYDQVNQAWCVNYILPTFIQNLLRKESPYTVTATAHFASTNSNNMKDVDFYIQGNESTLRANDMVSLADENGNTISANSNSAVASNKSTLAIGSRYLNIGVKAYHSWTALSSEKFLRMTTLSVDFEIKYNTSFTFDENAVFDDGAAPMVANEVNYGSYDDSIVPFRTSADAQGSGNNAWRMWYPELVGTFATKLDSYDKTAKRVDLRSYQSKPLTGSTYKTVKLTVVDAYNYFDPINYPNITDETLTAAKAKSDDMLQDTIGTYGKYYSSGDTVDNIQWTSNGSTYYASGIKTIQLGTQTVNLYSRTDGSTVSNLSFKENAEATANAGTISVTRNQRGLVTISISFYTNANVNLTVTDYGGYTLRMQYNVSGIDHTTVDTTQLQPNNDEGYISTGTSTAESAKWLHATSIDNGMELDITEDESDPGFSPYVWFMNVQKYDALGSAQFPSIGTSSNTWETFSSNHADLKPIALGSFSSLRYDFTTGNITGIGGSHIPGNSGDLSTRTGVGYYVFTIYMFDVAGNMPADNAVLNYIVKVDYEQPVYTAEMTFDGGTIGPEQNGNWITGGNAKLVLSMEKPNISGNTLNFSIDGSDSYYVVVKDGKLSGFNGTTGELAGDKVTITRKTDLDDAHLTITYADGKFTIAIDDVKDAARNQYYTLMWQSAYTMYIGAYEGSIGSEIENDSTAVSYVAEEWNGGIKTYVDRNAPETPSVTLPEGHTAQDFYYDVVPETRNWFTDGWALNRTDFVLEDLIFNTEFSDRINVFIGVKVLTSKDEFEAFLALDPLAHLKEISANIREQTYFTAVNPVSGFSITSTMGSAQENIALINSAEVGAGLRVITIWAQDQAGNISQDVSYAMFVDNTRYSLTAAVDTSNPTVFPSGSASLAFDAYGARATQITRGTTLALTADFADEFMPHKLTLTDANGNTVSMLENYMPTLDETNAVPWKLVDAKYEQYLTGFDVDADDQGIIGNKFNFTVDDPDNYGGMTPSQTITLLYRRVVSPVFESKATYNSQPVTPYSALNGNWSQEQLDDVKQHIVAVYRLGSDILYVDKDNDDPKTGYTTDKANAKTDEDGNPVYFTPILPGSYTVEMYILKDDPLYVMENFQMNDEGEQQFPETEIKSIEIVKGTIYVTPIAGNADYGMKFTVQYKVTSDAAGNETVPEDTLAIEGGLVGRFALMWQGATYNSAEGTIADFNEKMGVASYAIVAGEPFMLGDGDTYTVNFVSGAAFTINARLVDIEVLAATKTFGDPDPQFKFRVALAQFVNENAIDSPETIINDIFGEFYEKETSEGYYTYTATTASGSNAILREEGEHVQAYNFTNDASQLNYSSNFTLRLQTTEQFTITQRTVKVRADGSLTVKYGAYFQPEDVVIKYIFANAADSAIDIVRSAVESVMSGVKLAISDGDFTPGEKTAGQSEVRKYNVKLEGTTSNADVIVALDDENEGNIYVVSFADKSATIIDLKAGVSYTFTYGQFTWQADSVTYDSGNFEITNVPDAKTVSRVEWEAKIDGQEYGTVLGAGAYAVKLENVHLYGEDDLEIECTALIVTDVTLTISAAQIVVVPTYETLEKVYGQPESVFNIGYKIQSIGGQPIEEGGSYAGKSYEELLALVTRGSFVRVVYASNGEYKNPGGAFDAATDEFGVALDGSGDYYRLRTATSFISTDNNFNVIDQVDESIRFIIKQYEISLDIKDFIGLSKAYDGTDVAPYIGNLLLSSAGRAEAYRIADFALNNDAISLQFEARYTGIGELGQSVPVGVRFTQIALSGERAYNYKLGKIKNSVEDSKNKIYNNGEEASGEIDIAEGISVEIFYIDNTITSEINNLIQIYAGVIGVHKSDVTVSKVYDNTRALTVAAIGISNRTDEDDGASPSSLRSALQIGNAKIMPDTTQYSSQNVGSNYVVTLYVFFQIAGDPSAFRIANNLTDEYDKYDEEDVTVTVGDFEDISGIIVIINNVRASITQRPINGTSFATLDAVDRDYNGTVNVDMTYTYADGALAAGDSPTSVGLDINGISDGANAGVHTVSVTESSFVKDNNYKLEIDEINTAFSGAKLIDVNIAKAKLRPNVIFVERAYNGAFDLTQVAEGVGDYELGEDFESMPFTTVNDSALLASELKQFKATGELKYQLSKNGVVDPGVNVDPDTNLVIKHNVLVSGLTISTESPELLANYELYGVRYTTAGYSPVGNITDGAPIEPYELEREMMITRADLMVQDQNVHIADKVYDGTREATVSIDLPDQMPEYDKYFLKITATGNYSKFNVGNGITVTLSEPVLHFSAPSEEDLNAAITALREAGNDEYADYLSRVNTILLESLTDNYVLVANTRRFSGNIIARPVTVTAALGEKTYDGTPDVSERNITFADFEGAIGDENKYYRISAANGAFFDSKDVLEEGSVGTVYNPSLRHIKGIASNYVLSEARTFETKEQYDAYAGEAPIAIEVNGEKYFYADAESYIAAHSFVDADELADNADGSKVDVATVTFYYPLPVAANFIEIKSDADYATPLEQALASAMENGGFIGNYFDGATRYYAVTDEWVEAHASEFAGIIINSDLGEMQYIRAEGKINPRTIYVGSDAIKAIEHEDRNAFEKQYDGTTKFFGVQGENAEDQDGDFYYTDGSIQGVVEGDEVYVESLSAEFDNANTTAVSVVFSVTSLAGKDLHNYVMSEATFTMRLPGAIVKREIVATLADSSMSYGTPVNTVGGDVTYTMDDKALIYADNGFYMLFADYLEIVGIENEGDDAKFYEQLKLNTYNLIDGTYLQIDPAGAAGEYIKLGGNFLTMPAPRAEFINSENIQKPNAGDSASRYYLTGGDATNFTYAFAYSGEDSAQLTVTRKDVYVSATNNYYTIEYGNLGSVPSGSLRIAFYDEFGNAYMFASGDSYQSVFAWDGTDHGPLLTWYLYSWATGMYDATPNNMLKLADDLLPTECYVAKFDAPVGIDYDEMIPNYKFHFGAITHDESTGEIVYKLSFKEGENEDGAELFTAQTSVLTVVRPTITGITLNQGENTFPYDRNIASRLPSVVTGNYASDSVVFESLGPAKDVGTYTDYVKVIRTVKWDDSDKGVTVEWRSDDMVTITITPIDPQMSAKDDAKVYDGKLYEYIYYGRNSLISSGTMTGVDSDQADLSYEKLVNGMYYAAYAIDDNGTVIPLLAEKDAETGATKYYYTDRTGSRVYHEGEVHMYTLLDAGMYRITLTLNDKWAAVNKNYIPTSFTAYLNISAAQVEVSGIKLGTKAAVKSNDGRFYLTEKYDATKTYAISYNISMPNAANMEADSVVDFAKTHVVWAKQISSAGIYAFNIELNADLTRGNYVFIGASGVLELTQSSFTYDNSGEGALSNGGNGSLRIVDDSGEETEGVVANRLEVRQLKQSGGTATDTALWSAVEDYMPFISDNAQLAGIVQVLLYYDNSIVSTSGTPVELTIKLPETVNQQLENVVIYVKNQNGGLTKLTNYTLTPEGYIVYTTDYLGELVFVDLNTNNLPSWLTYVLIGLGVAVGLFVVWVLGAYIYRKLQLKKL